MEEQLGWTWLDFVSSTSLKQVKFDPFGIFDIGQISLCSTLLHVKSVKNIIKCYLSCFQAVL